MENNEYRKWYLVIIVFAFVSMFFGGSLAYWQWTANTEQKTNITVTVTEQFRCDVDGGGDITSGEKYLVPTDCMNSDYAIQRTIKVNPTLFSNTSITMDLWLDIKSIGTGLSNSKNFRYALTTNPNSCTDGIVKSGDFKGKYRNGKVELFNFMGYNKTASDTFYLYIWLDKAETSTSTMDQEFSLSLNSICTNSPESDTYVVFNEEDTTLRLFKRDEDTSQVNNSDDNDNSISMLDNSINNYNVEKIDDLIITEQDKLYFDLENTIYWNEEQLPWYEYRERITRVIFEDEIKPKSLYNWFRGMINVEYMDVSNVNTSRLTDVYCVFCDVGKNVTETFEIVGLDYWDVSNVTFMESMFGSVGKNATSWNIGDLSNWNVSSVTNMSGMFSNAGDNAETFDIGNLDDWDVSNVTTMAYMFRSAGKNATSWNIGDLSNWNVSKVTNFVCFFHSAAYNAMIWNIGDLSNWDVSNVTSMSGMFAMTGENSSIFDIGNLNNWNVSNVTNMEQLFWSAGRNATTWSIGDLSNWNVSNVTYMGGMFLNAGYNAISVNIGNLGNWDVSRVTSMDGMFAEIGRNATSVNIGDLSGWDVSNVTNMFEMFRNIGYNATSVNIGNLNNWDVSNVENFGMMFAGFGYESTFINFGNLSGWNTSNAIDMFGMFDRCGYIATNWSLDLSGWNVSNVISYTWFNSYVVDRIIAPVWVNEDQGDLRATS